LNQTTEFLKGKPTQSFIDTHRASQFDNVIEQIL